MGWLYGPQLGGLQPRGSSPCTRRAGSRRGGRAALAVGLLRPRSMARAVLAASLLNLSLLKPPAAQQKVELGARADWQWSQD